MNKTGIITAALLRKAQERIILPIDVNNIHAADKIIKNFGSKVGCLKVGLETMTALGGPVVTEVVGMDGGNVFYDGKFADIPNTTGKATKALLIHPHLRFMNVHASSGNAAIAAAVNNRGHMDVLVVTVLTSIGPVECREIFGGTPEEVVKKFAFKALRNGAQGIICSPQELEYLSTFPELKALIKVTPGIQPAWFPKNDQQRVMTPYEAIKAGADYLVIGRAITDPPKDHPEILGDSQKAIDLIAEEIAMALLETEEVKA